MPQLTLTDVGTYSLDTQSGLMQSVEYVRTIDAAPVMAKRMDTISLRLLTVEKQ